MNNSPKQRFLAEERLAKQFLDVVDSEAFQRASELAMIELGNELSMVTPAAVDSAYAFQRILGAQRFLEIMKALPEPGKPLSPKSSHNLNHDLR